MSTSWVEDPEQACDVVSLMWSLRLPGEIWPWGGAAMAPLEFIPVKCLQIATLSSKISSLQATLSSL